MLRTESSAADSISIDYILAILCIKALQRDKKKEL